MAPADKDMQWTAPTPTASDTSTVAGCCPSSSSDTVAPIHTPRVPDSSGTLVTRCLALSLSAHLLVAPGGTSLMELAHTPLPVASRLAAMATWTARAPPEVSFSTKNLSSPTSVLGTSTYANLACMEGGGGR